MQRVTAVVMVVYILLLMVVFMVSPPSDYGSWKALFSNQWMRAATLLFLLSLFMHAWIGVRDILMDYVRPTGLRLALQIVVVLALMFYGVWAEQVLWSI